MWARDLQLQQGLRDESGSQVLLGEQEAVRWRRKAIQGSRNSRNRCSEA